MEPEADRTASGARILEAGVQLLQGVASQTVSTVPDLRVRMCKRD